LGRPDAGVVPSDITWANLTKPYGLRHENGRVHPPYTAEGVVNAVTSGVDPAGNALDAAMPRYVLDDAAAGDLVAYLKRLGDDADQGIGADEVVLAAVLPGGGRRPALGDVVGRLLTAYFDQINRAGGIYNRRIVLKTVTFEGSGSAADALRRLMGESDVFAVVAPIVFGQSDALLALTEGASLPVVGPVGQYRRAAVERRSVTFCLTAGLDDQARALVKYARHHLAPVDAKVAILSADDGGGLNFADALAQGSEDPARTPVLSLSLTAGIAMADVVSQLRRAETDVIFLDGGPAHLAVLAEEAARQDWRPPILTISTAVTQQSYARLREAGARVFAAYPLLGSDQSADALEQLGALRAESAIPAQYVPMQVAALAAAKVLVEGLQRSGRDVTRAKFVAALAALQNFHTGLTPPISFGAGRRVALRGAHIVALGQGGNDPEHVWVSLD